MTCCVRGGATASLRATRSIAQPSASIVFERPEELCVARKRVVPTCRACGPRRGARSWSAATRHPEIAVVEVPLLFEAGREGFFDATIAVVADEQLREERASARGHEGGGRGGEGRQLSQDEKAARADYVIRNDGSLADLEGTVVERCSISCEQRWSGSRGSERTWPARRRMRSANPC